jgi:predicted dehydrogenase
LDPEGISYKFKTWKEWKRVNNQTSIKDAFNRQIDHFIAAVKKEGTSVVGNEEGIRSQLAIEAAYESIRQGGNKSVINEI